MDDDYSNYIKRLNIKSKGSIIYTGDPDFNERYLAKRRTFRRLLEGKHNPNLATKEQELELKAEYFESIAKAGVPLIKKYFKRKLINRANAKNSRKAKPSKSELIIFREKYFYDEGKKRGWLKAALREFDLDAKTVNLIINK